MGIQFRLDAGPVAAQEEAHVGMAHERNRGSRNDHAWPVVPAHGVERYGDWRSHILCRSGKTLPLPWPSRGTPRKGSPNRLKKAASDNWILPLGLPLAPLQGGKGRKWAALGFLGLGGLGFATHES